jgi:hypothetical protein
MPAIFDERTPSWDALKLERHVLLLKMALVPYFALVVCFWLHVFGSWRLTGPALDIASWALALVYLFAIAETFYIQKVMHDSAVYRHAAWQVLVGALCLNPCAFGWWMPVSVLFAVRRVRRQLEDLDRNLRAEGRTGHASDGWTVERRPVGPDWSVRSKTVIVVAVASMLLCFLVFLLWHFAQIQRVP